MSTKKYLSKYEKPLKQKKIERQIESKKYLWINLLIIYILFD